MNRFFGSERADAANDWYWLVPYAQRPTEIVYVPLMFKVHVLMPMLLGVLLLWVAWRAVNIPGFADFLVATEAEMNKVSWTNRRRLFQDTIVVLVTVFLMAVFLFLVDWGWKSALQLLKVLHIPKETETKSVEKKKW